MGKIRLRSDPLTILRSDPIRSGSSDPYDPIRIGSDRIVRVAGRYDPIRSDPDRIEKRSDPDRIGSFMKLTIRITIRIVYELRNCSYATEITQLK